MRKFSAAAFFLLFQSLALSTLEIAPFPFNYGDPASSGLGGQTTLTATGIHSLHGNPASFSLSEEVDYTLLAVTPWIMAEPGDLGVVGSESSSDQELGKAAGTGYGAGMSFAAGLTGKGVGLGILGGIDTSVSDADGIGGTINAELAAVVGYAMDFSLGDLHMIGGGDIRPLLRIYGTYAETEALAVGRALTDPADLFSILNGVENPYYGSGIGFDLGMQIHYQNIGIGASLRDVGGTRISALTKTDVEAAFGEMARLAVNAGDDEEFSELIVPMSLAVGMRYQPEILSLDKLSPGFYAEIGDFLSDEAPLKTASAGIELEWNRRYAVRGGYNGGGLSLGLGLDLPILRIDASYFSVPENGADRSKQGFALEGRLEF